MTEQQHQCETKGCTSIDTAKCINQLATTEDENGQEVYAAVEWLCDKHALKAGYCLGCHSFFADTESYDFSPIKGYCYNCVEAIRDELGELDTYDDFNDNYEGL